MKINRDVSIPPSGALKPKISISMAAIPKREPLKGFPDIQAKFETEIRGRQSKTTKILFEGDHFSRRAAIRK
jgi:hypothetical protein